MLGGGQRRPRVERDDGTGRTEKSPRLGDSAMDVEQQRHHGPDAERAAKKVHQCLFGHITFGPPGNHHNARRRPLGGQP